LDGNLLGAEERCSMLLAGTARLRIRPGETPVWASVEAPERILDRWRREAAHVGMPVDGLMAARLELHQAAQRLSLNPNLLKQLTETLARNPPRLPPAQLRDWFSMLASRSVEPYDDELPEVVLPARLTRGLAMAWWWDPADVNAELTRTWEIASAAHGRTIAEHLWDAAVWFINRSSRLTDSPSGASFT
jgi:hypothetical protein